MKWYKKLYIGESALESKRDIIKSIKKNKFQLGAYVLTLPLGKDSIMDIYPAFVLLQPNLNTKELCIIGIAMGKEEAFDVFQKIVMYSFEMTGSFMIKDFLTEFR